MSSSATRAGAGISSRAICCGGMTGSAVAATLACTGAEALADGTDAADADAGVALVEGVRASPRQPSRSAVALRMCSSAGEALPA